MMTIEEPKSLKRLIADEIRTRIVSGKLPLGKRISDKVLAAEMQISRTPVREALLQLNAEGLVEVKAQRGTYVFDVTPEEIRQICEARGIFESGAIRVAAKKNVAELVANLEQRVREADQALADQDFNECERLDTLFHETIIEFSRNQYIIEGYRAISGKVRALRHRLPQSTSRVANAIGQHRRILLLMGSTCIDEAAAELAKHVQNVQDLLTRAT